MSKAQVARAMKVFVGMYLRAKSATWGVFRYTLCMMGQLVTRFSPATRCDAEDPSQLLGQPTNCWNSQEVSTMDKQQFMRLGNQINEASGYLELGLPQRTLECLDRIENPGPLEGPAQYLRGAALNALERYSEAIVSLQAAAQLVPTEAAKHIWLTVSECYRHAGRSDLAIQSLANARGAVCPPGPSLPEAGEQPG